MSYNREITLQPFFASFTTTEGKLQHTEPSRPNITRKGKT